MDEIQYIQGRSIASRAAGGHDVTGAGSIIAQYLKGMFAQENTSGELNPADPLPRISHRKTEVLGAVAVGQQNRLLQVFGQNDAAAPAQRSLDDLGPAEALDLLSNLSLNGFSQRSGGGNQNRRSQNVVFGLR